MEKKLEQLNAKYARLQTQIEQAQHLQQRMENRKKYLEGGERKKRTHRLITRGAAVESIAPELKPLSEDAFYDLMAYIFSRSDVKTAVVSMVERCAKGT
jgi:translation initiation factor IF-3